MEVINSTVEAENLQVISEIKNEEEIEIIESINLTEIHTSCSNYNL